MSTRYVVVTGANKGIGLATVKAILDHANDTFVFLGSRDRDRGNAARTELIAARGDWADRVEVLTIDVGRDASVEAAAELAKARLTGARLFGLVNNAGIGFASQSMETVLNVNVHGPRRVFEAFEPLLEPEGGRVVNVASGAGPMFLANCSQARKRALTHDGVTWDEIAALMDECLALSSAGGDFAAAGLGSENAYGLSKACLNAYTVALARERPRLVVNACTPGLIATDMTANFGARDMKPPSAGAKVSIHLLFGDLGGSGWYFGSDAQRSPLDTYRSPGDPPYAGG